MKKHNNFPKWGEALPVLKKLKEELKAYQQTEAFWREVWRSK